MSCNVAIQKNIMQYNVQLINYKHGQQIRKYSRPVIRGNKKVHDIKCIAYRFHYGEFKFINIYKKYQCRHNEPYVVSRRSHYMYLPLSLDEQKKQDEYISNKESIDAARSLRNSCNRTKLKIYEIARSNDWEYFVTWTFNRERVDRYDYELLAKHLNKWLDYIKRTIAPNLVYLLVPEQHKDGAYHFHGLLSNVGTMTFIDSGLRTDFKSGNNIIYNMVDYYYGFSTATKIRYPERVCGYITKYITKELCSVAVGRKRYWCPHNIDKPEKLFYQMDNNELNDIIATLDDKISHVKTVNIPIASQTITYFEIADF